MTNLFKVNGQELTPIEIYPAVSDTVNYLTFAFMFSYDWAGLTKSAIFTKGTDVYEVVLTDDQVLESDRVNLSAGTWSISVVGDLVVDAVVTRQITTTSYDYTVTQSGATSGGVFPPSVANQVYINTNQETPQRFVGGIPKLAADRVISDDNDLVDKKHVADVVATVTADDFNHNDLANKQGGAAGEYYHITQAQNAALHAHSNKAALDAVSGTNTGDQDVSGAISTHNTDAGAHADKEKTSNKVTSITGTSTDTQYPSAKSVYNSTMRLLISRTIGAGENVSAITWTRDDAGNPLNLIDAEIRIRIESNSLANGVTGGVSLRLNGDSGSNYFSSIYGYAASTTILLANYRNLINASTMSIKINNSRAFCFGNYIWFDAALASGSTTTNQGYIPSISRVTSLYMAISSLTYFPTGTIIEIYGRTA